MPAKLCDQEALRRHWHESIPTQGRWLIQVVAGWLNYHAMPTKGPTLCAFRGDGTLAAHAAAARAPHARFGVTHPRWEPNGLIGPRPALRGGVQ
jgi:hypothetical protein